MGKRKFKLSVLRKNYECKKKEKQPPGLLLLVLVLHTVMSVAHLRTSEAFWKEQQM